MISVSLAGDTDFLARLQAAPPALRDRLADLMSRFAQDLYGAVQDNLSGRVLQRRSGRLAGAITQSDDGLSASVGFDPDEVPYGAAQEFGATIPAHLIAVKNAKALSFLVGGRRIFAKHVNFPGAVLPERSFLRSALADLAPDIEAQLADAVTESVE